MSEPLCLLSVHAHPDDEASKGAATVARYAADGVRTVLVCCTGGEEGEILNPEADTPGVRENLHEVRLAELEASCKAIGFHATHLLGYRDSGMPDSEANKRPEAFANADPDEAVEKLVRIIRAERPQVVLTYGEDHSRYPHPDHIRVHDITLPAFEAAGDPDRFPDAGEPWQPLKLYYMGFSWSVVKILHDAFSERGWESPFGRWLEGRDESEPSPFTTRIEIGDFLPNRRASLAAHRTQIAPDSFWLRLPDDVLRERWPYEEFVLARSLVDTGIPDGEMEPDLFAGIRERAAR